MAPFSSVASTVCPLLMLSIALLQDSSAFSPPQTYIQTRRIAAKSPGAIQARTWTTTPFPSVSFSSSSALAAVPPVDTNVAFSSMSPLMTFFLQTLISNGVPAVLTIAVIGFAAIVFNKGDKDEGESYRRKREANNALATLYDDIYGDSEQDSGKSMFSKFFRGPSQKPKLPKNTGVPKNQYLKVTHINPKYDSYQYSLLEATNSKAAAAAKYRAQSWQRNLGKIACTPTQFQKLQTLERLVLEAASKLQTEISQLQSDVTTNTIDSELKRMGLKDVYALDPNTTLAEEVSPRPTSSSKQLADLVLRLQKLELKLIQEVVAILGPDQAATIRTIYKNSNGMRLLDGTDRPLTKLFASHRRRLFVLKFPGDPSASQVETLRQEITALLLQAQPEQDEVLVVLQTGGGTVTGYGLAAAQLGRLKEANVFLTIAVEQVAASGGYMMACVADKIIASPFAVLGSIGVITDIPNVYERLRTEGIEFQTVTAGKYKRTVTPTKKVTREDLEKTKADVEDILTLFRDFVKSNRPMLDMDKVATGETWFGTDALERNLCDEIKTVDQVVLDYVQDDFDVYEVEYKPPVEETPFGKLLPASKVERAIGWVAQKLTASIKSELQLLDTDQRVDKRYMAQDDTDQKIRVQD